ncbi:hypothetical protein BRW65_03950 [Mycobacterium paraffinicum]|uniref:Uncharacterized protein n=1 Tax=Mycobacterium paraffinicum TaxID=53378 RepID=A0A1Q4I1B2_9MYCO|nr:hypothetical protein [Mycobacterium paraffinicum]OJZ75698.1 hypothetical protein BRW65_03950 [Mycobacterium paraffinicum]
MTTDYEADRRTREERHREVITQQLGHFPRELARCTCNTPSFDRDDHANTCPLGPAQLLSSGQKGASTRELPELRF